jgi:hypothetical protein
LNSSSLYSHTFIFIFFRFYKVLPNALDDNVTYRNQLLYLIFTILMLYMESGGGGGGDSNTSGDSSSAGDAAAK